MPEESAILQRRWSHFLQKWVNLGAALEAEAGGTPWSIARGSAFSLLIWGYASHRQYYMQNAKYHLIWEPLLLLRSTGVFLSWANLQSHWGKKKIHLWFKSFGSERQSWDLSIFFHRCVLLALGMKHLLFCFMGLPSCFSQGQALGETLYGMSRWTNEQNLISSGILMAVAVPQILIGSSLEIYFDKISHFDSD